MLGRRRALALSAALAAVLAVGAPHARADGIAVADLYAESDLRDAAGATTLLVRSMLDVGAGSVAPRADLQAAIARAGGAGLLVPTDKIRRVLADVSAKHLVSGSVRRDGTRLAAMIKVHDARGASVALFKVDAPDGDVTALAKAVTGKLAELTGVDWRRHPKGSIGQLRPFVRAGAALLNDDPSTAAEELSAADTLTAGRVQAARQITEPVWRDSSVPLGDRMLSAIVGVDAKAAMGLADNDKDPDGLALRARAHLSSLDLGGATAALDKIKQRKPSRPVLLARAELAHRKGKSSDRDDALAPLLGSKPYVPALPVVASWPPGALGDELEGRALDSATWAARRHPRLASTLALRAARGDVEVERALSLVFVEELDDSELGALGPVVDTAVAAGWADGYRLRAELSMRKGDTDKALADVRKYLEVSKGNARGELYLGRLLTEQGKTDEALAAFGRAAAGGTPGAKQAHAAALVDAGRATEAKLAKDDNSVVGLRARAARLQQEGSHDEAIKALEAALRLDPNDPAAHRLLANAYKLNGNAELAAKHDKLAKQNRKLLEAQQPKAAGTDDDKPKAKQAVVEGEDEAELVRLAQDLPRLLDAFPAITERRVRRLVLVPLSGSKEPFYMPRQVQPDQLRDGLERALSTTPYKMTITQVASEMTEPLSATELNELAQTDRADGVLLYRLRADGKNAKVKLSLFEVSTQTAYDVQDVIERATSMGLVVWNKIFLGFLTALGILFVGWLVAKVIRGTGEMKVRIKMDPAAQNAVFNVVLSRKKKRPPVGDPKEFAKRHRRVGHKKSRLGSTMAGPMNEYPSVPTGRWNVHVIGVYEKGVDVRVLPDDTVKRVRVKRNQVVYADFDLVPTYAEYMVHVFDGLDPLNGTNIWIDDDVDNKVATNREGEVTVHVPKGSHILRIDTGTMKIEKRVQVGDTKIHHMHVNLERERKLAEVSGGISLEAPESGSEMVVERGGKSEVVEPLAKGSDLAAPPEGMLSLPGELPSAPAGPASTVASPESLGMPSVSFGSNPVPELNPPGAGHAATQALGGSAPATPAIAGPTAQTASGMSRYERVQELGRGAMGVVYKATDLVLERAVALKIMTPEMRQHPTALKFFLQEAKALAQLNHSNIVTVFDQGMDGGDAFMVMEFVEGTTLEDMLEGEQPLPLDQALDLADQLCRGLAYAHGKKVIHRDIKPANIFVSNDGIVKLGDFGLAKVVHELKIQRTEVRGTPLYMSPEQIRGVDIDHRSDLYAVGCTMYELVTGRPPFIDGEILYHHINTEPPAPSEFADVPRELERLILKCIRKDQATRVASADAIRESLKSIRQRYG